MTTLVRHLTVPAEPGQLARLATFAASAAEDAGFDSLARDRIELAMDEACSNIIEHAYGGRPGPIDVRVEIQPHTQLVIRLVDRGRPFDPSDVPQYVPNMELDKVRIGGLGLYLMRKVMDEVRYEFDVPGVGNRLTMIKRT